MVPEGYVADSGSSFKMDMAVTVLPDPLSPTRASVSPFFRTRSTFSTALVILVPILKDTLKLFMVNMVSFIF